MLSRCQNLKVATTLFMAVVVAATGFAPVAHVTDSCMEHDGVMSVLVCFTSARCCCGTSPDTRACCCRQNDAPYPQPPAIPNDSCRTIKWMPWIDELLGQQTFFLPKRSNSLPTPSFSIPFQRSIQSLLCVWRI